MNRKIQRVRLLGLYLCILVTVTVVWIGYAQPRQTPAGQANPFTGTSFRVDSEGTSVSSRGFEPGARTHWHTHSAQLLFVKEGRLRYQVEGRPIGEASLHETAYLPRGVRHWHGATPGQGLTHVSVTFPDAAGEPLGIEWMEPVSDEQYAGGAGR